MQGSGRKLRLWALVAIVAVTGALAACGEGEDVTITEGETTDAVSKEEMSDEEIAGLEAEIADLQEQVESEETEETTVTTTSEAPPPETSGGSVPADAEDCGAGVFVDASTTSCEFGLNVAEDYFSVPGNTFESFSPATDDTYTMTCSGPPPIVCTGGNGATVYITGVGE